MSVNIKDIQEFFIMFKARFDNDVELPALDTFPSLDVLNSSDPFSAAVQKTIEKGYQLSISIKQLERLVQILKSKGFYHDDDYTHKLREEELIMSNPELKHLHDQYKTYLYMLNGDQYDG